VYSSKITITLRKTDHCIQECFVDIIGISLQNGCATAELEAICYALIKFSSRYTSEQKMTSELVRKSVEIGFSILTEAATSLAALPPSGQLYDRL